MNVLRAEDVRAQRAFQSWIERHVSRRVDYDIDVVAILLSFFLNKAEITSADVRRRRWRLCRE